MSTMDRRTFISTSSATAIAAVCTNMTVASEK